MLYRGIKKIKKDRIMLKDGKKTVTAKLSPETHKKLKLLALLADKTVSDYVAALIEKDIAANKDKLLF